MRATVTRLLSSRTDHGSPASGLALGIASHALAGLSPFIVAAVIARTALLPGTALVYSLGTAGLAALLVLPRARRHVREWTPVLASPAWRGAFVSSLAGFLVAGVAFYIGLTRSSRVAEYVFLTRLDWIVQAPVAILVLREPWTGRGLAGAAVALAGGLLLVWTGAIGTSGLAAALVYVAASAVAYLGASPIARAGGLPAAIALTGWRHVVNTIGFVLLAVTMGPSAAVSLTAGTVALGMLSAGVLLGLFLCRFAALTRVPLWVLSAQAPVQAVVALVASRLTEGAPSAATLIAVVMIVSGELIVANAQRTMPPARVRR
jgi:drug/metabolite transporter (DMT)-like permease